jgi:ABC-type transport system involved in cytochrome c biogenesis permease subunit
MFLLLSHKAIKLKSLGVVLLPCVIAVMMVRLFASAQPGNPPLTFSGLWFILHVVTIKLSMVAFLIAFCAAILYLLKGRERGDYRHRLPSLQVLDAYGYRYTGWAFVFWGAMIVSGALWAEQSWGRYWGWDAIETWSLISWLLLGLLLHLRRFLGWQGKRAAWAILGCFAVSILTMFLLPFFLGSVHSDYLKL